MESISISIASCIKMGCLKMTGFLVTYKRSFSELIFLSLGKYKISCVYFLEFIDWSRLSFKDQNLK